MLFQRIVALLLEVSHLGEQKSGAVSAGNVLEQGLTAAIGSQLGVEVGQIILEVAGRVRGFGQDL